MEDLTEFQKQLLWNIVYGPFAARVNSPLYLDMANKGYIIKDNEGKFVATEKGRTIDIRFEYCQ